MASHTSIILPHDFSFESALKGYGPHASIIRLVFFLTHPGVEASAEVKAGLSSALVQQLQKTNATKWARDLAMVATNNPHVDPFFRDAIKGCLSWADATDQQLSLVYGFFGPKTINQHLGLISFFLSFGLS